MMRTKLITQSILTAIFLMTFAWQATAVTPADKERELRINEYILKGLLEEAGNLEVSSRYYPGYGFVFTVHNRILFGAMDNVTISIDGEVGRTGFEKTQSERSGTVKNFVYEFLTHYHTGFRSLDSSERVAVIYDHDSPFSTIRIGDVQKEGTGLGFVVWVTKEDLSQHARERISDEELTSRIKVTDDAPESVKRDIRVFRHIVEGEMKQNQGQGSLNKLHGTYLPDLGFIFDASVRAERGLFAALFEGAEGMFKAIELELKSLETVHPDTGLSQMPAELFGVAENALSEIDADEIKQNLESVYGSRGTRNRSSTANDDKLSPEDAFNQAVERISELLLLYTPNMQTLKPNEYLIINIHSAGQYNKPGMRSQLKIKKSDLDRISRGQVSSSEMQNLLIRLDE